MRPTLSALIWRSQRIVCAKRGKASPAELHDLSKDTCRLMSMKHQQIQWAVGLPYLQDVLVRKRIGEDRFKNVTGLPPQTSSVRRLLERVCGSQVHVVVRRGMSNRKRMMPLLARDMDVTS